MHAFHLLVLGAWGGLVAAELVIELSARATADLRAAAALHYKLDLWVELPVLVMVLVSGSLLTLRVWPLDALHALKIGCGLGAVVANLYCVVQVIRRHRARDDEAALRLRTRRVYASAVVGVPLALVAAYVGWMRFRA